MSKRFYTLSSGLLLLHALCALTEAGEPYCNDNETIYDYKPVHKTRTITVKPTGLLKILKKPKTYTEEYVEQERYIKHWKLVPKCCEGYQMSALRLCEPYCPKACPKYASCVEPNRCQCENGYVSANSTDGSHYCEPICEQGCHEHAHCSAPNVCECKTGYAKDVHDPNNCLPQCSSGCPNGSCLLPEVCKCDVGFEPVSGICEPVCLKGDGCRHGHCIEPEVCHCLPGYQMNESTQSCEKIKCPDGEGWHIVVKACVDLERIMTPTTEDSDATTTTEAWASVVAVVASINASSEIMDVNEHGYDTLPGSSSAWEQQTTPKPCLPGFIYYHGECRPQLFPADENDCHLKDCVPNAVCKPDGSCACFGDFFWSTNRTACLSMDIMKADMARSAESDLSDGWLFISLIALGVAIMVIAILVVGFKLMRRQRGRLNVEAKNDLYCEYENKSNYADVQLVL